MINVVYLDDEFHLCQIFKEFMEKSGFDVAVFTDEHLAIEYCAKQSPSIMFIDFRLKKMTGDDVAFQLKTDFPKILVTGELNATPKYEFCDVIPKPYRLSGLVELINKHC